MIDIIGAPTFLGCDREGPESSPARLRGQGLIDKLQASAVSLRDMGDLKMPEYSENEKFADGKNMKYLPQVTQFDTELAECVYRSVSSGGKPIVIGGDHSIALGSISGSASYYDDLGVIWIDAHGDINTNETSPSGNLHGMCLAALMGFGDKRLTQLYTEKRKIDPRNVFLVGVRSLDQGEVDLIEREGINVFYMDDIQRKGIEATVGELIDKIKQCGLKDIHCSLDIDVLDPAFAPGTGTTVKNGMNPEQLYYLIDTVSNNFNFVSSDVVEFNPYLDVDNKTVELTLDIISFIARHIG